VEDSDKRKVPNFASLGDRLIAQAVDGLVAFGVFYFTGMIVAPYFGGATKNGFELKGGPAWIILAVTLILILAYFILAEAFFGATLGKMVAGIRVRALEDRPIGIRASAIRNLLRCVDGIGIYLVGAITVMMTRRKQRLGDLAAGTVVHRWEANRLVRIGALAGALFIAIIGAWGGYLLRNHFPSLLTADDSKGIRTLDAYAPRDPNSLVKAVSLCFSEKDAFDPDRVGTAFSEGVRRIVVWYRWAGSKGKNRMDIRWFKGESLILEQGEDLERPEGSSSWILKMSAGGTLPLGTYHVELLENGRPVTRIPFLISDVKIPAATPWGDRGWKREVGETYVNADHGLRLTVPKGWTIGNETQYEDRVLWVMYKLGGNGQNRMVMSIIHRKDRQWRSVEEFFQAELESLRASTVTIGGKIRHLADIVNSGPIENKPQVYEIWMTLSTDGNNVHQIYFLRRGVGYIVTFKAAADITDEELSAFDLIQSSMGIW
jgi:uncharacterized RDD family membrane protein YckC